MAHFAISMNDGSLAVMETVGATTVDAALAKWPASERAKVVSNRPINVGDVPSDRTYRNAWVDDGAVISVDMPKARTIHRVQLRQERAAEFARLDADWMKAVGQGDTATAAVVEAERQTLRDAVNDARIDAAATPDDLKALTLDALVRR